jgi:heme/copper-type cytochrome/quinol oxidase subunit 3
VSDGSALSINEHEYTATGVESLKLGVWLFLASEVMFFTGFIGSYIVLRLGAGEWPVPGDILAVNVLAVNTFVLILSSLTMALALESARLGNQVRMRQFLAATIFLGLTFLVIKLVDYHHMWHTGVEKYAEYSQGFALGSGLFADCYYMLTGFHGLHVLAGVITLICVLLVSRDGRFGPKNYSAVECAGLYWHFVDLVWIVLFAILCLM